MKRLTLCLKGGRETCSLKGEDGHSFIRIQGGKEDNWGGRLTVECSSRGFSASVKGIYVFAENMMVFLASLQTLETTRRGNARLTSAARNELDMEMSVINRRGHVVVYDTRVLPLSVDVAFGIDPTELPAVLGAFEQLKQEIR